MRTSSRVNEIGVVRHRDAAAAADRGLRDEPRRRRTDRRRPRQQPHQRRLARQGCGEHATGHVVFVGAGPGAADLITVRGAARLAQADVVLFDALTDPALRGLAPRARWIDVGKRGFADSTGQATINALLVKHAQRRPRGRAPEGRRPERLRPARGRARSARAGRHRVRGRARRDRGACRRCGNAAPAHAARRRPQREPGHGDDARRPIAGRRAPPTPKSSTWPASSSLRLSRRLLAAGWPAATPVCVVSRAGWPDQRQSDHTVGDLAARPCCTPVARRS